jgi:two-component system OmpR family response regulator
VGPSGVTVLVVEDDADLRYLFRLALTVAGFSVREAADGYQALVSLEQHPADVLVLDLGLPRVDGISVLEELAARSDLGAPSVVVVTGIDGVERSDAVVLRKPVESPALVGAVRGVLRRSSAGGLQA